MDVPNAFSSFVKVLAAACSWRCHPTSRLLDYFHSQHPFAPCSFASVFSAAECQQIARRGTCPGYWIIFQAVLGPRFAQHANLFLWCLRSHLEPPAFTTVTTQLPPSSWRSSKHKGRVGTLPMARADLHAPLRHLGPWSLEESHVLVKRRQRHKSFWLRDKNVWWARGKADKNEPHVHRKPWW